MAALWGLISSRRNTKANASAPSRDSSQPQQKKNVRGFRDLNDAELGQVASILCHQPAPNTKTTKLQMQNYQLLVRSQIKHLPAHLRAQNLQSPFPTCKTHQGLNSRIAQSIFVWIQEEVEINVPTLLRILEGTYCDGDIVRTGRDVNPRWSFQNDGCASCMLARVGGEADILLALKGSMTATTSPTDVSKSRRHLYLDALIAKNFDPKVSTMIFQSAEIIRLKVKEHTCFLGRWEPENQGERRSKFSGVQTTKQDGDSPSGIEHSRTRISVPCAASCDHSDNDSSEQYTPIIDIIDEYRETLRIRDTSETIQLARRVEDLEDYPFVIDRGVSSSPRSAFDRASMSTSPATPPFGH
ncbi:uncharacterized protein PV09_04216 [Verruconis gallopava]|uniref:Uncharacterized protein n=1 Tax=Verruconis gallopava TaxID=253628 RepID=A0A0D1XQX6_9PEZI|nr:uncharacterized protein PV09_04216 [Verruconis gallopava]KIW05061.1 hypothetical protein PV09_04216 [Verruconis gallopava]